MGTGQPQQQRTMGSYRSHQQQPAAAVVITEHAASCLECLEFLEFPCRNGFPVVHSWTAQCRNGFSAVHSRNSWKSLPHSRATAAAVHCILTDVGVRQHFSCGHTTPTVSSQTSGNTTTTSASAVSSGVDTDCTVSGGHTCTLLMDAGTTQHCCLLRHSASTSAVCEHWC